MMRKALVGILAAIILLAVGAYFGSDLWAQFRTKNEVEAVFDTLRTSFPTASHGRVELYTRTRSVKISDIILQAADRATTVKIGAILAVGGRGPRNGRVEAGRIDITNWELTTAVPLSGGPTITYKAPTISIESFAGPGALPVKINTASMIDLIRASVEYVAGSSANAITIPRLTATVTPAKTDKSPTAVPVEYVYNNLVFRDIRDRRIGTMTVERATFTSDSGVLGLGSFAGALASMSVSDFNVGTLLALFDPAKAKDDTYQQLYGRTATGPFEMRFAQGPAFQIDAMSADDIAIRPSKLSITSLLAMADSAPKPGAVPTPEQLRLLTDQVAYFYEGMRIGKTEIRGFRSNIGPGGTVKIGVIRLAGLENGRLAEFAFEGVEGTSPMKEPVHVGRFALLGLNISGLVRNSTRMAETGRTPAPDQLIGLLSMLEGVEINDVITKNPGTNDNIRVDAFRLAWSQFVNAIPTRIRLSARTSVPTTLTEPAVGDMLSGSGLDKFDTNIELGVTWDEATQTVDITPVTFELANAFSFNARMSVRNVPRSVFSPDPALAIMAADGFEAGPLEVVLRDTGGIKTALTQYAKRKGMSEDDARKEIIASVTDGAKAPGQPPEAAVIADAIAEFIEKPGSTITITVTPKGKVSIKEAIATANVSPDALTAAFTIEAKTTR